MSTKLFKNIILVVVVGNLLLVAIAFLGGKPAARPDLPRPNGFDDFLRAGQLAKIPTMPGTNAGAGELRALLAANAEPLTLVRAGLARECALPSSPAPLFYVSTNLDIAIECKALSLLLQSDGRLAELELRTNDALRIYLEEMRFSHEIVRGGFKVNLLVGQNCETKCLEILERLAGNLNAAQCRETAAVLTELGKDREPTEKAIARDADWWSRRVTAGDRFRYLPYLTREPWLNPLNVSADDFLKTARELDERMRKLIATLTARG